jgi:cbb3-type cytochrome c oxidase subunit III
MIKKTILVIGFTTSLFCSNLESGKELFNKHCSVCHGKNGNGLNLGFDVNPRNLTKSLLSKEQIEKIITNGAMIYGALTPEMRAFKDELEPEEIQKISAYISENINKNAQNSKIELLFKSEMITEKQKTKIDKWGKKIFKRNCAFCHGMQGKGDGIATKNPENSIYPYDLTKTVLDEEQIFLYTKFGGKHWGTARGDMPPWSKKYNDFKLKAVAKYVDKYIKTLK